MFFFVMTNTKQQCYPLCFFSWRPIKNYSVTPYGFFHEDQRKTTASPFMFHLIKTTVLPLLFFFMMTKEIQQYPPMFYLININSVTPHVYFMTANKKWQLYPCRRFHRDLYLSCLECWPPNLSMHHQDTELSHYNGYTWLYNSHEIEIRDFEQRTSTGLEPQSPGG